MSTKHGSHWLEREDFGDITVVRLKALKIMDEATAKEVFDPIYTLTTIGRAGIVLNLAVVDYLSSMALGKLVMLNRRVQVAKGRLTLCHLSPNIKDTLETTRLNELFEIYATEQDAVQSYKTAPKAEPGSN